MLAARIFRGAAAVALSVGVAVAAAVAPPSQAADPGPVELAIIAPIVAPAGTIGLLSSDALDIYTGPGGALTRQLDAVIDRPVTLAIDPMIIASIRALGGAAPVSAATWLDRLERAGNESFLLPYADSDVTLGIQAGSPFVIAPESFAFAIDPANFGPAVSPEESPSPGVTPSPTPTDEADLPALPTTDDLLAWPNVIPGLVWPRAGTVAESDLATLTLSGFSSVILSSGNVTRDATAGPLLSINGSTAIVTDDTVSERLGAAAGTSTTDGFQSALPSLRAAVASAGTVQSGQAAVVATLPRSVQRPGTSTAASISALLTSQDVTLVPLSVALADREPIAASLAPGSHDQAQISEANRLLVAESADARFAPIVDDATTITAPRRLALLALLSTQWGENPTRWTTAVANYVEASEDLRSSVEIVTTSPFTLLADNGTLPIPVSNQLGQAVTVYLTIRPLTAQLAVTEINVPVTIEPNSQARASVPVQAISNGSVQAVMTLSSSDGSQVGQPAVTEINVQAGWETPVVLIIGGLVVVVFAVGLVRNILRRRGSKESAESTEDAESTEEADTEAKPGNDG